MGCAFHSSSRTNLHTSHFRNMDKMWSYKLHLAMDVPWHQTDDSAQYILHSALHATTPISTDYTTRLKRKCHHFDEIFMTSCNRCCGAAVDENFTKMTFTRVYIQTISKYLTHWAWDKMADRCRRHFKMHFFQWNYIWIPIPLQFIPMAY